MTWLQLRLETRREDLPALEECLLETGAVAVTLEDNADEALLEPAVGETPLWQQTRLTGLYPADTDMNEVLAALPDELRATGKARVEILEDKDWEREWMQHYRPMRFGERLWICPSWLSPPDPSAINLLLDPGLAFGTGTHPTTSLCLDQLDGMDLAGQRVVDYGCGSGILAVAALKLGARIALGVDNDPQALSASRENAMRNDIARDHLQLSLPDSLDREAWTGTADVVVANILAGPLMSLAETLLSLLKPGAELMLAGLLSSQAEELIEHYASHIALAPVAERDDWVCLRGTAPKH